MQTINGGEKAVSYIFKKCFTSVVWGRFVESCTISIFHSFLKMPLRTFTTCGAMRTKRILVIAALECSLLPH